MATQLPTRNVGSSRPDTRLFVRDHADEYMDFSGYTVQIVCRRQGQSAELWTKTNGIVASSGSDTQPNLVISWTDDDLGSLPAGEYVFEVRATFAARSYVFNLLMALSTEV